MASFSARSQTPSPPQEDRFAAWSERLARFGQSHVLAFWDSLNDSERETLLHDLDQVDLDELESLRKGNTAGSDLEGLAERLEDPPAIRLDDSNERFEPDTARQVGEALLASGLVGVVVVAGGQGTRLGFDPPKGMYPIGPLSGATLFQILCEKIRALSSRFGVSIPLLVMTSPATHADTVAYLREQQRFGMEENDVFVFCQGVMPAIDGATGKLLLGEKHRLALSPDGHGGMVKALDRHGIFRELAARGIEHLFYLQIDNPLVEVVRPEFLGYHVLANSDLTTQVVAKTSPQDKVGNLVSVDGKVRIIEYSDLPADIAEQRRPDGGLRVWAGNTAIHAFSVAFLEASARRPGSLPFHVARKKVPCLDETGARMDPEEPNGIKFEKFIFDLLPSAQRTLVVEVDAERVFAPVKNAPGSDKDTPEHVQRQMCRLHAGWLKSAGVEVAEGVRVEISPLYANLSDEVAARVTPGMRIDSDTYLGPQ